MKTFKNYLLQLLEIICVIYCITWLVSCDDNTYRIRLIQRYEDSVGLTKLKLWYIDRQRDSLTTAYIHSYPAKAFRDNEAQAQRAYAREEQAAYHELIKQQSTFDSINDPIRTKLLVDLNRFKRINDSLKLTLQ